LARLIFLALLGTLLPWLSLLPWRTPLDSVEATFRRMVLQIVSQHALSSPTPREQNHDRSVHVLMLSAHMRITELEMDAPALTEQIHLIQRVGGVRPIDRCKFARVVTELSRQLRQQSQVTVVAFDVDLAPVESVAPVYPDSDILVDSTAQVCGVLMAKAIKNLREHVAVVAIVMGRETEALRRERNAYLVSSDGLHCTQDTSTEARKPLYLATPHVFYAHGAFPLDFPFDAKPGALKAPEPGQPMSSVFPSLSNIVLSTAFLTSKALVDSRTQLCRDAAAAIEDDKPPSALPVDALDPELCGSACANLPNPVDHYRFRPINWRRLDSEDIRLFPIERLVDLTRHLDAMSPGNYLAGPALIVGIDGGAGHDKFAGATVTGEPIPGPMLHALQTVSAQGADRTLQLNSVIALLADLMTGLAFVSLWSLVSQLTEKYAWVPHLRRLVDLIAPATLAYLFSLLCVYQVSPLLLDFDIWANPVYMLIGLALGIYVDAALLARRPTAFHPAPAPPSAPDFTFSFADACSQLRQHGYRSIHFGVAASLATVQLGVIAVASSLLIWGGGHSSLWPAPPPWHAMGWLLLPLWAAIVGTSLHHIFSTQSQESPCSTTH
jgi:hypothetical protein